MSGVVSDLRETLHVYNFLVKKHANERTHVCTSADTFADSLKRSNRNCAYIWTAEFALGVGQHFTGLTITTTTSIAIANAPNSTKTSLLLPPHTTVTPHIFPSRNKTPQYFHN